MHLIDFDHTVLHHINDTAKALEKVIHSGVICYFGEIHPQYVQFFRGFVEGVKSKSTRTESTISIVLRTSGGSAVTTERLVNILRHHYSKVNFIVPDLAMSAGTIFCMSGDKLYMDYASSLGPIDPQVVETDGGNYASCFGYLDKVAELTSKSSLTAADEVLLKSIDLAKLALFEQERDLSIDLLKLWLVEHNLKDWNVHRTTRAGVPVTIEEKEARAQEIAIELSNNKRWVSHERALGPNKLREIRLEINDYSGDATLTHAIHSYNDLLTAYTDRLGLTFFLHSHAMEPALCRENTA